MSIRLMGGNVSFFTQARAGRDGGAVCNLDVSRFFFVFIVLPLSILALCPHNRGLVLARKGLVFESSP